MNSKMNLVVVINATHLRNKNKMLDQVLIEMEIPLNSSVNKPIKERIKDVQLIKILGLGLRACQKTLWSWVLEKWWMEK